jgi:hypothetical protein
MPTESFEMEYHKLAQLIELTEILGQQSDFDEILRVVTHQAASLLRAETGLIMMINPRTQNTIKTVFKGGHETDSRYQALHMQVCGWVIKNNRALFSTNIQEDPRFRRDSFKELSIESVMCAPLRTEGVIIGSILLLKKNHDTKFDEGDLAYLEKLAAIAAPFLRNVQKIQEYFAAPLPEAALLAKYENQGSRVHIFYGNQLSPGLTPKDANVLIIGGDYSFGSSIATGDVDADGKADLLVEDFGDDLDPAYIGTFYLFLGSSLKDSMSAQDADWRVTGTQSQQFWSSHWSTLGDVDGNGRADVVISSPPTNAVYIFTNPRLGQQQMTDDADIIITGELQQGVKVSKPFIGNIIGATTPELFVSATQQISATQSIGVVYAFDGATLTGISDRIIPNVPFSMQLFQNYPNPFNPETTIQYALAVASEVQLIIYDLQGREIIRMIDGRQPAGLHGVIWDGKDHAGAQVASGVYLYRLTAGRFTKVKKAVFLK